MPTWLDPFPDSPLVSYQYEDGSQSLVPREQAMRFGYQPLGATPPVAEAPPPLPAFAAPAMPATAPLPINQPLPAGTPEAPTPASRQARLAQEQAQAAARTVAAEPAPPAPAGIGIIPRAFAAPPGAESAIGTAAPIAEQSADVAPASQPTAPPAAPAAPKPQQQIDQERADAELDIIRNTGVAFQAEEQRQAAERLAEAQRIDGEWTSYQSALKKASDHKIDPGRKWASMGTGRQIGAIIAAAVSGLGAALAKKGGPNFALDLIMNEIDKDVALQMDERRQLGENAQRQRLAIDDLRQIHKDRDAERMSRKAAVLGREAQSLREVAGKAASEGVATTYLATAQAMEAEAAKAAEASFWKEQEFGVKAALAQAEIDLKKAQTRKTLGQVGGGGPAKIKSMPGGALTPEQIQQLKPHEQARYLRLPERLGGHYVPARNPADADKAEERLLQQQKIVDMADEYLGNLSAAIPGFMGKLASKAGFTPAETQVIESHNEQFKTAISLASGQGAISADDAKRYEKIVPSATAFNKNALGAIRNLRDNTSRDGAATLYQLGVDVDWQDIYGRGPQLEIPETSDQVLGGGAAVPRVQGRPDVDRDGKVMVPNSEEQRANVRQFVDQAKRETLGGGELTAGPAEGRFRNQIINGPGGLAATSGEMLRSRARLNDLQVQLKAGPSKKKGAPNEAQLKEEIRRETEVYNSMVGRRDALEKEMKASEAREKGKRKSAATKEAQQRILDEQAMRGGPSL